MPCLFQDSKGSCIAFQLIGAIIRLVLKMQQEDGRAPSGELNAEANQAEPHLLYCKDYQSSNGDTIRHRLNATIAINVAIEVGTESSHDG